MSKRKTRDLRRVRDRKVLFWPEDIASRHESGNGMIRLRAGGVVDMDAPLERDRFCRGQEYKLESAPQDAVPDPITNPRALRLIAEHKRAEVPPPPQPTVREKADRMGIMDPVEPLQGLREFYDSNTIHVGAKFGAAGVTQGPPQE